MRAGVMRCAMRPTASRVHHWAAPRPSLPLSPCPRALDRPRIRAQVSPGFSQGRAAAVNKLAQAKSLQDLQDVVDRYGDYLTPGEIQQLVTSVAPRLAQQQQQQQLQQRQLEEQRRQWLQQQQQKLLKQAAPQQRAMPAPRPGLRQSPGRAPAAFAERLAAAAAAEQQQRAARAEQQRQAQAAAQQQDLMRRLAGMTRQSLPQFQQESQGNLADTVYALAHAGALDESLAQELLQYTTAAASAGQLDVQGLADVLAALGRSRYRPTAAVVNRLLSEVNPLERCESVEELSALLNGLSRLGYRADESFVEAALKHLQQRQAQAAQQQQQPRGAPDVQPDVIDVDAVGVAEGEAEEDSDSEEEQREREEARHVAATIQALQRMGHVRQAAQLQASYLSDLQTRAARRMQARQDKDAQERQQRAAEAEKQRQVAEARRRLEEQEAEKQRWAQAAAEAEWQQEAAERAAEAERQKQVGSALVLAAMSRARSWRELASLLYSVPSELWGGQELVAWVSYLPALLAQQAMTWRDRNSASEVLEQWAGLMTERLQAEGGVGPGELTQCMQAVSHLRYLDQTLWGAMLRSARTQLPQFTAGQLVSLLRALATAGLKPSAQWQSVYVEESMKKLQGCTPDELLEVCQSMAQLEMSPGSAWVLAYLGAVQVKENDLSMAQAAACLQAAARLDGPLVQRWYTDLVNTRRQQARAQERAATGSQSSTAQTAATSAPPPVLSSLSDAPSPDDLPGTQEASGTDATALGGEPATSASSMQPSPAAQATAADTAAATARGTSSDLPPAPVASIDFDEEAAKPAAGAQLPDTFLIDRLHPHPDGHHEHHSSKHDKKHKKSKKHKQGHQGHSDAPTQQQQGSATGRPEPAAQPAPEPLTPAQRKALKSVLLERVEMAEETQQRTQEVEEQSRIRGENAAIQLAGLRSQLEVLQADYDRVLKRHADEKLAVASKVQLDVFSKLLPLVDNFERAASALKPKTPNEQAIHDTYQQIPKQISELLKSAGVEEVPGVGEPFDPAVHEAIMQEYDSSVPDGTVLMVFQQGYKAGDQLMRPALVKVSSS